MVLMASDSDETRTKREQTPKDRVYEILRRNGHYTVAEISVEAGLSRGETEQYLWALAAEGHARRTTHGYVAMETVNMEDSVAEGDGGGIPHAA